LIISFSRCFLTFTFLILVEAADKKQIKNKKPFKAPASEEDTKLYFFMCIEAKTLQDLVELYPETGESIKYIAIDRRRRMRELVEERLHNAHVMERQMVIPKKL